MAWNEPGGNQKDPWGKNDQGPPDLDELLKNFQNGLSKLFGGKSGGTSGGSAGMGLIAIVALLIAVIWFGLGIYKVDERERAVVLRFGKFEQVVGPGLHWMPVLIDSREIVSVTNEREYVSRGLMLTEDENIVEIPVTVQFNIADVKAFVLNVNDPTTSLRHATDSAIRHVIGSSTLDKVLSDGRQQVAVEVKERLQTYLDSYGTGIQVVKINLQRAEPPKEVKAAFDDVIEAKEDRERYKNEAQAYSNSIIPEARGQAQRVLEEASAYRARVVAEAIGDANRFEKLLAEYHKAPTVTRERLYIGTLEKVFTSTSKVLVDVENGNNMFYMPLDRVMADIAAKTGDALTERDIEAISRKVIENISEKSAAVRTGGR